MNLLPALPVLIFLVGAVLTLLLHPGRSAQRIV